MIVSTDAQIRILAYAREDLIADDGMLFDDVVFFGCELTVLLDNVIGYSDLARIMQQSGVVYPVDLVLALTDLSGDLRGILRNTQRMSVRILILGIDRIDKSRCRLLKQSLRELLFFLQVLDAVFAKLIKNRVSLVYHYDRKNNDDI